MNNQRKIANILHVFQYNTVTGAVTIPTTVSLALPDASDASSRAVSSSWVRTYVSGLSYITGNQSITVSGDATGSGTTAITLTLANTAVTPGTYGSTTLVPVVTVDSKGRITSVTTAAISGSLTFTGDVTGTGTTGTSTAMTLAASGVTAGTYTKVTVDSKGRVTVGANASTTDISEGTNLYYTDARVGTYLTANSYATQSYVGTQVANLVAAAPATLDTLNELAAALGNDPSFATTVSTSIGTKVPQTRTLTINGTAYDLSADRAWTIVSMIYPSAGIAISTGTGWGTSITDNSANWNTAYGWGNHASGGYLTSATAATTYASLTGTYANPAFISSLAYSKITGVPAFLTSYTETDPYRVTSVAVSGTSTKTITLTRADASTVTTTWTDIDTDTNTYVTSAGFSGGTLTLTRNDAGTVTVSLDGRYYLATNPSGYITSSGSISGTAAYATQWGTPSGYANFSSTAISASVGWLFGTTGNGTYAPVSLASVSSLLNLSGTNTGDQTNISGTASNITAYTINQSVGTGNSPSFAGLTINTGGTGTWGPFVVTSTSQWGDGGTLYATIGAGGAAGIMINNPHIVWNASEVAAVMKFGRSGGISSGSYYNIGTGASNNFFINKDGAIASPILNINSSGNTTFSGTISASNLSGTNTGDQTNISGNAATATNVAWSGVTSKPSNIMYYQSFTLDANTMDSNATGFTYSVNAPFTGPIARFSTGGSYDMWLGGNYGGSGNVFYIRTRNGDAGTFNPWRQIITDGNIGSQTVASASNATTAGGLAVHTSTNNEANKIVRTDANGYIQAGWINSISGNMGFANRIARITCSDDQYMRFQTLTEFKVSLGMSGKNDYSRRIDYTSDANYHVGSFGHGGAEVGNIDRIFHYGSGFFDVWSGNGTYAPSTSHIHGFNALHYTTGYGGNAYGWQMASQYNQTGLIYARWCNAGSFSAWQTIITSANIGSQSVSYATTAGSAPANGGTSSNTNSVSSATGGGYTWTGINYFETNNGGSAVNNSNSAKLQAYSSSNNTAFMSFHRGGYYATNFGLDNDNVFRLGGWSAAANRWQLDMSGNMTVAGDVTAYSDARVKENIVTIENALSKVLALRGVSYNRIDSDDKKTKIGVIAQETLQVVPEVVNQDNDGMFNVSYGNLAGLFIEAFKEQQKEIEELKTLIYGITR